MVITPSTLDAAFIAFDTTFQRAFTATRTYWQDIATMIPSSTKEQRHAWLKRLPEMREWLGERVVNNLSVNLEALVNKKFEHTFGVDRTDIEDDLIGVFTPSIELQAEAAAKLPDKQLITVIQDGQNHTGPDGVSFFSASHPKNPDDPASTTQSNYYSSGKALTPANFDIVRSAMKNLVGEDLVSLEIDPKTLMVPPNLEITARQLLNAEFIVAATGVNAATGSQSNVFKGTADVLVVPRLSGETTAWYLMQTDRAVRPFIWQERTATEFAYLNRPTDPNAFLQDKYLFGTRRRGAAGYGPYYLVAKAVA